MSLAVLADLPARADDVASRARNHERVVVSGPAGSGRWTLGDAVLARLGADAIEVSLPPFEALDGPLHGLMQIAASLGPEAVAAASDTAFALPDRVREVCKRAASNRRVIVIRVPASWQKPEKPGTAGRARREALAASFFEALFQAELKIGVVALVHPAGQAWIPTSGPTFELGAPRLDPAALADASRWGAYTDAFHRVRGAKGVLDLSPIQLRLLVGVTALGQAPEQLLPELWGGFGQLTPLLNRLVELLAKDENRKLRASVLRIVRSRFPLPRDVAVDLAAPPSGHAPLLTECLGYTQGAFLRLPDEVRARLLSGLLPARRRAHPSVVYAAGDAAAHAKLADYHKSLDGDAKPPAERAKCFHWLERVYNLGRMGGEGEAAWKELSLAGPEQLLDRAWSLSVEFRDYAGAADLYRQRLAGDPTDGYAWHYLGFNLQRAGAAPDEVERTYRRAIEIDPSNPWWNSRLITFLIHDLRFREAEREWRSSIDRVDPKEVAVGERPWLARHLHRWVAHAWLHHGEVERARAVFSRIPRHIVRADPELLRLQERVDDAVEALTLGESVYPAHVPMAHRWRVPRVMPERKDVAELEDWMPGRITFVGPKTVAVVMVQPKDRRVLKQEFPLTTWRKWSRATPSVGTFFEIGFFGEDEKDVLVVEVRSMPPEEELPAEEDAEDDVASSPFAAAE